MELTQQEKDREFERDVEELIRRFKAKIADCPTALPIMHCFLDHIIDAEWTDEDLALFDKFFDFARRRPYMALYLASLSHYPLKPEEFPEKWSDS